LPIGRPAHRRADHELAAPVHGRKVFCPIAEDELAGLLSYQLVKSLYSIANGGFGGTGLGKGTFATTGGAMIPDVKTDFIYSALARARPRQRSALLLVFIMLSHADEGGAQVDDGFSKLLAAGSRSGSRCRPSRSSVGSSGSSR
jgi:cell division protein FtsW (lipid II flippase)